MTRTRQGRIGPQSRPRFISPDLVELLTVLLSDHLQKGANNG